MELTALEFMNGLFSLIFVVISTSIGIRIALRYLAMKERTYLLVGFTWVGLTTPWYPSTLSFLSILITGETLINELKLFLGMVFLPLTILFWMMAFTDLLYREKQKAILIVFIIIGVIFEVFYLYFLFTDPSVLGREAGPIDEDYTLIVTAFVLFYLIVAMITGTIFARVTMKSDNPEHKLKGKLLLAAFYSFGIGAVLDILSPLSVIILIAARIVLISSAFEFYGAFILPNWMKKLLLK